jgi:hypothetical protein
MSKCYKEIRGSITVVSGKRLAINKYLTMSQVRFFKIMAIQIGKMFI